MLISSFTIAVDYFQARYPGTTIVFDISLVYIIMAFFAVLGNNVLVETLDLNTRITFGEKLTLLELFRRLLWSDHLYFLFTGYLLSFITLLFVAFVELWWEIFGPSTSYTMTLIAVAVVALGCTGERNVWVGNIPFSDLKLLRIFRFLFQFSSPASMVIPVCYPADIPKPSWLAKVSKLCKNNIM